MVPSIQQPEMNGQVPMVAEEEQREDRETETPAQADHLPVTRIRPLRGWQLVNVRELWQFRELVYFLVWRDVKVRYKQTVLGVAWAVLQPAMMMVVFTIFFGRMAGLAAGGTDDYPIFVLAGLLPWTFFSTAVTNAGNSVVGSERLITKTYFPRLAVPYAAVGAAVVDFLVSCGLLAVMMAYYRVAPTWHVLLAPVIFCGILLLALGVGTLLAALNVTYRDVRYVIPFLIQLGMFATPTIYAPKISRGGGVMDVLLNLNPMATLIAAFRECVFGRPVDWVRVGVAVVLSILIFVGGCLYFRQVEDRFADII